MKIKAIFFLILTVFFVSCSASKTVTIQLENGKTEMPEKYVAVLEYKDGSHEKFICPLTSENLRCDLKKIEIKNSGKVSSVFLKMRNFHFEKIAVKKNISVTLQALDSFDKTDDFVSGMNAGESDVFDSFAVDFDTELGKTAVLKFYIKNTDTDNPQVYFQNTKKHQIHYDFAVNFAGEDMSSSEFTKAVYTDLDRTRFAGSIVHYEDAANSPFAMTFFPGDTVTPEQAANVHRIIEERLKITDLTDNSGRLVYLPAGESQEIAVSEKSAVFESMDIPVITLETLYSSVSFQLLNEGRACGTLKKMSPEDLETTPVSFKDILILTRIPNQLPVVGGTITEEFQTPLSHVNVAARNRGTPNIALHDASENAKIKPFIGKLVEFIVKDGNYSIREISEEEAEECWTELKKEPFTPESDTEFDELPLFKDIVFEDSIRVGVKAANLAVLSQLLPDNTPSGFAIPFHYYREFTESSVITDEIIKKAENDCTDEGRTAEICSEAAAFLTVETPETIAAFIKRMLSDSKFKSDTVFREATLNALRYIIYRTPVDEKFAETLNARVKEVFGTAKIRLRSSTNAEDLENFSGAGLYDSTSAYSSGDDAASVKIGKVWASIWNFSAFEEREFWGIDHTAVFMGICVSTAFEDEASNGVIITRNISDPAVAGMYINVQPGEASVTNPEDGGIPEIFVVTESFGNDVEVLPVRYSSLSPDKSILTHDQIKTLYKTSLKAHEHFAKLYGTNENAAAFDIEFKFDASSVLMLKQIRPYSSGE